MASAKSEARKLLGKEEDYIDLKGLNKERDIANQIYNTNKASYENAYNDLLSTLASNRTDARTEFGKGRSTVSENAFMKNREASSDLASRGLSGGIGELSKLGTRMETGRQYSDLANSFYRTMSDIDTRQSTGERDYNLGLETAKNELSSALAGIGAREAAARNNYKAQVAQLAEQIQARRDAAAQAAAALKLSEKQYKEQQLNSLKEAIYNNKLSWAEASDYLVKWGHAKDTKDAIKWLKKNTTLTPTNLGYSSPSGYKSLTSVTIPTKKKAVSSPALVSSPNNDYRLLSPFTYKYDDKDYLIRR